MPPSLFLPSSLYNVWGPVTKVKSSGDIGGAVEEPQTPQDTQWPFSETPPNTHRFLPVLLSKVL